MFIMNSLNFFIHVSFVKDAGFLNLVNGFSPVANDRTLMFFLPFKTRANSYAYKAGLLQITPPSIYSSLILYPLKCVFGSKKVGAADEAPVAVPRTTSASTYSPVA